MSKLGQTIAQYWSKIQESLFPRLEEELDPLAQKQQQRYYDIGSGSNRTIYSRSSRI